MQGAERREVVKATPADIVANRAGMPGVQMRSAKTPQAMQEAGRGAATLAMLAEKALPAVQELHNQQMREDYLKGKMQFSQGKAYADIKASGASYATVSGAASMQAQKMMQQTYIEGLKAIDAEDHKLTTEQYTAKLGALSKALFTGDQLVDNFMTEIAAPQVMKLAEAQTKAHEAWKVQETKSAKRDLILSTSIMQDPESDGQLQNLINDPSGLNPEDHKQVMLEAAMLDLKQGSRRVIDKLGGIQGIRDKFSTTAAEESAIIQGFDAFIAEKENEWSSELTEAHLVNYTALAKGQITHLQATSNAQAIAEHFGKGNKSVKAMASDLWGAEMKRQNHIESEMNRRQAQHDRMLEKAQEKYEKELELYTTAGKAVSEGALYSLDAKTTRAAFDLIQRNLDAGLMADLQSGKLTQTEVGKAATERMAKALDKYGVVNPDLADELTSKFTRNLVSNEKGEVYESTVLAYQQLKALHDINPGLAMQHLKTDAAKSFFIMAKDLDVSTDFASDTAIRQAATNMRSEVTPRFVDEFFGDSFDTKMQEVTTAKVVDMAPNLKPWTGTGVSGAQNVSTWELERAATNPVFLKKVTRLSKAQWLKNPNLTQEQAANVAMDSIRHNAAYMVGNIIVPESDSTLHKVMQIPEYTSEPGAPHEAMVEYLKQNGQKMFGEQWFDTVIANRGDGAFMGYLGTKVQSAYRDVPEMYVDLQNTANGYSFIVQPVLNDSSAGAAKVIPAAELGAFYKKWRSRQVADVPKADIETIQERVINSF